VDVVYLCRPGANEELRFSLRSLAKIAGIDQVWVFGGMPDWVRGVRWFQMPMFRTKHQTTNNNLRMACEHPEVSDPFILMNDDFYVMRSAKSLPVHNRGTVRDVIARYEAQGIRSDHVDGMRRTLAALEHQGYEDPLSFELHTPFVVHKDVMLRTLEFGPYQRRTVYGALAGLRGRRILDPKVSRVGAPIPQGTFLSTMDETFEYVRPTLEARFPNPSRHE